jgi:hypothetical protein
MQIDDFVTKSLEFVQNAKHYEQDEYSVMCQKYANAELEAMGYLVQNLKLDKIKPFLFKKSVLVFSKSDGSKLSDTLKIRINDSVILAERRKRRDQENLNVILRGFVLKVVEDSIHVVVDERAAIIKAEPPVLNSCLVKAGDVQKLDKLGD